MISCMQLCVGVTVCYAFLHSFIYFTYLICNSSLPPDDAEGPEGPEAASDLIETGLSTFARRKAQWLKRGDEGGELCAETVLQSC